MLTSAKRTGNCCSVGNTVCLKSLIVREHVRVAVEMCA